MCASGKYQYMRCWLLKLQKKKQRMVFALEYIRFVPKPGDVPPNKHGPIMGRGRVSIGLRRWCVL